MTKNECPTISVIIPAYNAARYLRRAVDSVLSQENIDFELIIVDNNSGDKTLEIAKDYAQRFPTAVKVLTEHEQGASAARNSGLRIATGRFVKFIDADDRLLPGQLSRQNDLMKPGVDWLIGTIRLCFLDGRVVDAPIAADPWAGLLGYVGLGHLNANLFRKETLIELGGFDGAYPSCDDFDLFFRYLKGGFNFVKDEIPGAEHIHHTGPRITNTRQADMARQRMNITERVVACLREEHPEYYKENLRMINSYLLRVIRKQATVDMPSAKKNMSKFFPAGYQSACFEYSLLPKYARLYSVFGVLLVEHLRVAVARFIPKGLRDRLKQN